MSRSIPPPPPPLPSPWRRDRAAYEKKIRIRAGTSPVSGVMETRKETEKINIEKNVRTYDNDDAAVAGRPAPHAHVPRIRERAGERHACIPQPHDTP